MSFTAEVKDELARVAPVCSHCEKSALAALIRIEGSLLVSGPGKMRLEISTDVSSVARFAVRILHDMYQLKTELTVRRSVLHKTPNYLIVVVPQPALPDALKDMGILDADNSLIAGIQPALIKKQCCAAAYLRGAFLGSGFVANPRGDFHFEIAVTSEQLADDIAAIMKDKGINAKVVMRRNSHVVYLKSGSAILEFLAYTGAHQCALAMENERVIKSVRNDVNRKTNAEVANQAKSVNAQIDQIYAIRKVVDKYGIENLPPALREYIRLRVQHPEATIKELGEYTNPPLSKSAMYHRVRRIEEMARGDV